MRSAREAGRELDVLVAEKVMGYRWHAWEHSGSFTYLIEPGDEDLGETSIARRRGGVLEASQYSGAHYSTDIAAAWLVVERMRAQEFKLDLGHALGDTLTNPNHYAAFIGKGLHRIQGNGPTAPLAICLAALAVCEKSQLSSAPGSEMEGSR